LIRKKTLLRLTWVSLPAPDPARTALRNMAGA
jgi:hypothetical protein